MARPTSLSLTVPKRASAISSDITSPTDAGSSSPSPREANSLSTRTQVFDVPLSPSIEDQPNSPEFTSLPPFPSSPKEKSKHARESSKGFFSNLKASKSSQKVYQVESTIRQVSEETPRSNFDLSESGIYSLRKSPGSTPDLSLTNTLERSSLETGEGILAASSQLLEGTNEDKDHHSQGYKIPRRPVGGSIVRELTVVPTPTELTSGRKPKPRFGALLQRTRSTRLDDTGHRSKPTTPVYTAAPEVRTQLDGPADVDRHHGGPKTAPLQQDRSLRDMMSSNPRNRSADRQLHARDRSQENMPMRRGEKASSGGLSTSSSSGFREGAGSHLFTNLKNTSSKAADGLGKAGKGFFGKIARSGSSNAREEEQERYVISVINLPLVEQTRRTRIARRLEDSKDKTEFWMPALPWRCIE